MHNNFQERIIAILRGSPNGLTSNEIAELVGRTLLGDDLGRDLGIRGQMMAEEYRIGHFNQRIVHLEVENLPDAAFAQAPEQPAIGQGCQRAAMTVRTREQPARRFEQQLAGGHVQGGHRALAKEVHVVHE